MINLYIKRIKDVPDGTLGEFLVMENDSVLFNGYTLEPAGPDTITPNKDKRIPAGIFQMGWHNSPTFRQTLPHLFNDQVPKERYILIHAGNFPKDTFGCVLVGCRHDGRNVLDSKKALKRLLPLLKNCKKVIIDGI